MTLGLEMRVRLLPLQILMLGCMLTPPEAGQTAWIGTVLWAFRAGSGGDEPLAGLFARKERISQTTSLYGATSGFEGGRYRLSGNRSDLDHDLKLHRGAATAASLRPG
jgi:hypothetical protein